MVTVGAKVTTANNPSMAEYRAMHGEVTLYWLWVDITEYTLVIS